MPKASEKSFDEGKIMAETKDYICPHCGGSLEHDIKAQKFMCRFCKTETDIEAIAKSVKEYDFSDYLRREREVVPFKGTAVVACKNCGAESTFSEFQYADVCPMCRSPKIITDKQKACIPPEGIVPFKIDEQDAQQRFRIWVKKRWFAPNDFKKSYGEGGLRGMYLPFWTYDSDAVSHYSGLGGKRRIVRDKDGKTSTRMDWYPVSGVVSNRFDDVLICASDKESQVSKVLPFRTTTQSVPYTTAYLSGYYAEIYKFKADFCFERAKRVMDDKMHALATAQIMMRYDAAQVMSLSTKHRSVTYKHMLLPLWGAVFGYKGKTYSYLINGETGKVAGERPYSIPKIAAAVIAAIIAVAVIVTLAQEAERYGIYNEESGYYTVIEHEDFYSWEG